MMGGPGGMMDGMMGGSGAFGSGGNLLGVLLLLALLAAVVWVAYKPLSGRGAQAARPRSGMDPAEGFLRERFARGAIGGEEYERSLRTLRGNPAPGSYEDFVRNARGDASERRT